MSRLGRLFSERLPVCRMIYRMISCEKLKRPITFRHEERPECWLPRCATRRRRCTAAAPTRKWLAPLRLAQRNSSGVAGFAPGSAGLIDSVAGIVAVIRGGGSIEQAAPGTTLFNGDFLQAAGSSVIVVLGNGQRLAVQERGQLIVHAPSADGTTAIETAGGRFVFFGSGMANPTSSLVIDTPAARIRPGNTDFAFQHAAADGLRVTLAENAGPDSDGVVVENSFGSASIREGGQLIAVDGSDRSPIVERDPSLAVVPAPAHAFAEATSGLTLAEGLEASPGGDLNALPGDPIVVTGAAAVFDLTPQPASLQEPLFTGVLTSNSASTTPRHMTEELLLGGAQQQLLAQQQSQEQQQQSSSSEASSRQLRDWEPLGLIWDIFGEAEVTQPVTDIGPGRLIRPIVPTEAATMALVVSSTDGMGPIDDFFGLPNQTIVGALTATTPASASAIRSSPVQLTAGSTLSFDWFLDSNNLSPRHDIGMFVIDGRAFMLADSSEAGAHGATGWRTFAFRVEKTGTYTLGFVTINDLTTDDPSRLFVDNVRRDRTFGDDYIVVDSGTGWQTLVRKATLRDDVMVVGEDARSTTTALALLSNDTDPDPFDPMGIVGLDRLGTRGMPGFSSDGTISFDPAGQFEYLAAGETATTSFRYEADAGNGVTGFGTVRVTIVGANDAPIARADTTPSAIAADAPAVLLGVLVNDDDIDSDDDRSTLRVVAAQAASGAAVDVSGRPGEGIIYRPGSRFQALATGETAVDIITYTIEDRHGARATATASVTIAGRNDAPSALTDTAFCDEDAAQNVAVLTNDTDPDTTDRLHVGAVNGVQIAVGGSVVLASGASVTRAADETLAYDPRARFDGLALGETATDSFRYQAEDGHGGTTEALVTVSIAGRNDAPIASHDTATIDANNAPLAIDVLFNDDDVDSDDSRESLRIVAAEAASGATVTFTGQAGVGLSYDPSGRFQALGEGETGTDTITYTIEDRHGARSTATVSMMVRGINDTPQAIADAAAASEDGAVEILALANDTDPDAHDTLTIVAIDGQPIAVGGQVTLASGATVGLAASGNLWWSPAGRFDGLAAGETSADTFRYRIADGHGGFVEADVMVRIEGRNDAPSAAPDLALAGEDGPAVTIDVLSNDDDDDSDDDRSTLRVIAAQAASGAAVSVGADGRLHYSAAGHWDQVPLGETAIDTISYTVEDRHGARSAGTVMVTVTGVNDSPTAVADTLMIDADTVLRLPGPSLMANDRDPDLRDTRTIIAIDGVAANVGRTMTLVSGALLTVNADGSMTYDPNGRFGGLTEFQRATDGFTYTMADSSGAQSSAAVTVQIQGKNDAPAAAADTAITDANSAVRIPVLINDTDADAGGNLRVLEIDTAGSHGQVRINADGTLTWDPGSAFDYLAAGERASDTFRYVVDDFVGGRSTAVVTVTVVGTANPLAGRQELLQSFEVAPLPNIHMEFLGSIVVGGAAPEPVTSAFRATHQASMAVLTADGSQAAAIERYLSNDVTVGDRPLISLPSNSIGNSSPTSGAAMRATLSLGAEDIADGRASVSFDWNFISAEVSPGLSNLNDYALFTVTDGAVTRVFKLADARSTNGSSDGWRTSVFELGSAFTLPTSGELRLTVGFAVLNDETPANPSHLLIDNLRLNRPMSPNYEMMRSEAGGSFTTFRERPFAGDDAYSMVATSPLTEDAPATLSSATLFANDRPSPGADAASLQLVAIDRTGTLASVTLAPGGSIVWDPRGRFDFLAEGQTGTDSFQYTMTDANGGTGTGRTTLTVTGLNDAPTAMLDKATASENGVPVSISVLTNDDDIDNDDDATTLRVVAASAASGAAVTFAGLAGAAIAYDPRAVAAFEALAEGEVLVDTVSYTVEDRHGAQAVGTVAVSVVGRNDAPTAFADTALATEDSAIIIPVLTNDRDPDLLDRLGVAAIDGRAVSPGAQVTLASGAIVTVAADGTASWDPRSAFASLARGQTGSDFFSYTASDGHGGSSTAAVEVSVAGLNDAPIAATDALSATAGTRLTIAASTLLSNDSDVDTGDALRLIDVDGGGASGLVSFDGSVVTWDPMDRFRSLGEGETATDNFTYRVSDNDGATTSGTVSLTVHGINDAPTAVDDVWRHRRGHGGYHSRSRQRY